jgi:hypothetical protein
MNSSEVEDTLTQVLVRQMVSVHRLIKDDGTSMRYPLDCRAAFRTNMRQQGKEIMQL